LLPSSTSLIISNLDYQVDAARGWVPLPWKKQVALLSPKRKREGMSCVEIRADLLGSLD
jgi:hypothetical protein